MTGAELAARVTAARAARGDFERQKQDTPMRLGSGPAWQVWAERLSAELGGLLDALTLPASDSAATGINLDGSATLSPADVLVVIGAVRDGIAFRGSIVGRCRRCGPGIPCESHQGDSADLGLYQGLAYRLGDDR